MSDSLSVKLKKARIDKGLTLEQLAKMVDSSKSYIWQLENKPNIQPSVNLIKRIAVALDISVNILVSSDYDEESEEEHILFREYRELDAATQEMVKAQIKALRELQRKKKMKDNEE